MTILIFSSYIIGQSEAFLKARDQPCTNPAPTPHQPRTMEAPTIFPCHVPGCGALHALKKSMQQCIRRAAARATGKVYRCDALGNGGDGARCGKSYASKDSLRKHTLTDHENKWVIPLPLAPLRPFPSHLFAPPPSHLFAPPLPLLFASLFSSFPRSHHFISFPRSHLVHPPLLL